MLDHGHSGAGGPHAAASEPMQAASALGATTGGTTAGVADTRLAIVPPELLERPHRDEMHRLDRDLCALVLDPYLHRLASQEARCRRVLGALAREFLRRDAHHALGFARLDDYAHERLDISGRELQSAARVVAAQAGLPALAAAFDCGTLSWTQVRLLVPVARPETEAQWLVLARQRTVRALEALIAAALKPDAPGAPPMVAHEDGAEQEAPTDATPPVPPGAAGAVREALDDCTEDGRIVYGEPEVTLRVRCPRWVRSLWREVVELARRMAGEPLAVWRAAEAIAAEGLSAPEARPHAGNSDGRGDGAAREDGPAHGDGSALEGKTPARLGSPWRAASADPTETRAAFTARSGFDTIDWSLVAEALPADVEALGGEVTACDARTLDARMRAVMDAMRRVDWQLGRILRLFLDCRLYAILGFSSGARYVRERLGISTRKARMLVALERKTWACPALLEAYRRGAISCLRALTIAPVANERHGAARVARTGEITLRRLHDEVAWALDVQDARVAFASVAPPAAGAPLVVPPRQMRAPHDEVDDAEVSFRGPASVVALFRNAVAAFHAPLTPAWTGLVQLLAHAKVEWERQPRHRDPVFARDGWRCTVPACSARRNLHDHHIRFRSQGGDNIRGNRVTICAAHHLHGIHAGRISAWGRAPEAIHWQLGVQTGRRPLLELLGERYVKPGSAM
jgi:hypothetical protein